MATYKAEFLAHHYAGRLRPRAHYSMGWLPAGGAARRAGPAAGQRADPGARSCATCVNAAGGIDRRRRIPLFAGQTLQAWCAPAATPGAGRRLRGEVVLWPDTFTNHLDPGDRAGGGRGPGGGRLAGRSCRSEPLCCGLTWISTGQLAHGPAGAAAHRGRAGPVPARAAPVVGLEPSCTAVFRPTRASCCPGNRDVQRLQAADRHPGRAAAGSHRGWQPPHLGGTGDRADALPPARHHGLRRRPGAAARRRRRRGRAGRRLLRAGRQLRLRGRALRRVPGRAASGSCCPRCATPPGHPGARRRVQLPHPDRAGRHRPHAGAPRRDTGRRAARCWPGPCWPGRTARAAVPARGTGCRRLRPARRGCGSRGRRGGRYWRSGPRGIMDRGAMRLATLNTWGMRGDWEPSWEPTTPGTKRHQATSSQNCRRSTAHRAIHGHTLRRFGFVWHARGQEFESP